MGHQVNWANSRASCSVRENGGNFTDWASSSSSASTRDNTEDDQMIAQVLSEELSGGDRAVGKRLAHLSSIPHVPRINRSIPTLNDASFDYERLSERLREYGLQERKMTGDGNCQFRAISDQFYRTPEKHKLVRKQVVYQLKAYKDLYEGYVPMKYGDYLRKMKRYDYLFYRNGLYFDPITSSSRHERVNVSRISCFVCNCGKSGPRFQSMGMPSTIIEGDVCSKGKSYHAILKQFRE